MTYRIMAIQETGEEICLKNGVKKSDINRLIEQYQSEYIEYRDFWAEDESPNYGSGYPYFEY